MTMMRRMAMAYSVPRTGDWAQTSGAAVSYLNYLEAGPLCLSVYSPRSIQTEEEG